MREDLRTAIRSLEQCHDSGARELKGTTIRWTVYTIVGIVGDIRHLGPKHRAAGADVPMGPNDIRVFLAAVATLAAAGLLASANPARRAASVDPLVALRTE